MPSTRRAPRRFISMRIEAAVAANVEHLGAGQILRNGRRDVLPLHVGKVAQKMVRRGCDAEEVDVVKPLAQLPDLLLQQPVVGRARTVGRKVFANELAMSASVIQRDRSAPALSLESKGCTYVAPSSWKTDTWHESGGTKSGAVVVSLSRSGRKFRCWTEPHPLGARKWLKSLIQTWPAACTNVSGQ